MDIGTAKPTTEEQARVPHHLIDVVDPGEPYDVFRYQRDARAALDAIAARGRLAILVGGTGLYVRAVLDGLDLASLPSDPAVRADLERRAEHDGAEALHRRLAAIDPAAAARVDTRNVRRVIRYLEIATLVGMVSTRQRSAGGVGGPRIGLRPPRAWLDEAILARTQRMVAEGVLGETAALLARELEPSLPSMTAHGYVHWARHLRGEIALEEAISLTARDVRAYSRRQMTWFRRDKQIEWVDPTAEDPLRRLLSLVEARPLTSGTHAAAADRHDPGGRLAL
jgi:tRNA dimethylallyltransferase